MESFGNDNDYASGNYSHIFPVHSLYHHYFNMQLNIILSANDKTEMTLNTNLLVENSKQKDLAIFSNQFHLEM